jgi:hypothetical protein
MKKKKIILIAIPVLLLQVYFFSDYLSPVMWGEIKVRGLACTCPDETVVNGSLYLRYITPDSLRRYEIDYSEIYTDNGVISVPGDPMGNELYIIKGIVVGKDRVDKGDLWNLRIKVKEWHHVNMIANLFVKFIFAFEVIILAVFGCWKWKKDPKQTASE